MSKIERIKVKGVKGTSLYRHLFLLMATVFSASLSAPICAQDGRTDPEPYKEQHMPIQLMKDQTVPMPQSMGKKGSMDMSSMQGGKAPANARDTNAYSDGYEYTSMPGMQKTDQMYIYRLLIDQLELTHSNEGNGVAWDISTWYGPDESKLYLRSEGGVEGGTTNETTSAEVLWWRPFNAFWATLLGLRQDFGPGSHTYLALGVEGLASYWFDLQATLSVAEDGRLTVRLKGSYDLLLTNRLILTPEVESNLYSRDNSRRGTGAGVGNIEPQMRLRYEFSRKFAPYVGIDWDCKLGRTADQRREEDEPVSDTSFVAGIRSLL